MLNFGILTGKNIMSFGSGGFEFDLSKDQVVLLRGKSGHGKSTILEALTYCLFGKPYRDIKLSQLINTINNKGTVTTVEFQSGSDRFKVIRGMKPAIFEIYKNDELIPEDAATRDYQKMFEETILGFGYKTFKQICVIGSTSYKQFMTLSSSERRLIIEELLDIYIFSQMSVFLKTALTKMKDDVDLIDRTIISKNGEVDRLNKILDEMKESERKKREEYTGRIESIEQEKISLNGKIDQYNEIVDQITEKLLGDSETRSQLQEGQMRLRSFMEKVQSSKESIRFFEENDHCSTCLQEITDEHKKSILTKENGVISESMAISKEIYSTLEQLKSKTAEFDEFANGLNKAKTKLIELRSSLASNDSLLASLNKELTRENDSNKVISQKEIVSNDIASKMEEKIHFLHELDYYNVCVGMLKDTGIKSKIIATFIPLINESVNKYLESFDMFVNFELDENFSETIKSRHRDSFTYESFSNGERARIDCAMLLTWREVARRKNSVSTNLLIFDETCDSSLDDDLIDIFINVLREQENTNTVIISHRQVDPMFFDQTYFVEKKSDDFSRLSTMS